MVCFWQIFKENMPFRVKVLEFRVKVLEFISFQSYLHWMSSCSATIMVRC